MSKSKNAWEVGQMRWTTMNRSQIMSRIRGFNTKPERLFEDMLVESGMMGYEKQYGKYHVDFAWVVEKVAVFVDGCFWHYCPKHYKDPKSNTVFWLEKKRRNIEKGKEVEVALIQDGWKIIRIWECEMKSFDVKTLINEIKNRRNK